MIASLKTHLKWMLSGKYGTISAARVMSCVFALFSLIVLSLVIGHMLAIDSAPLLHEWVETIPALGGVLVGLVGLPYSVNRVTSSLADLIAALKRKE